MVFIPGFGFGVLLGFSLVFCVCAVGTDILFYFDCYYRNKKLTVGVLSERSLKTGRCLIFC